jgi:hypothetical protein
MESTGTPDRHPVPGSHRVGGDEMAVSGRPLPGPPGRHARHGHARTDPADARDRPDPRELRAVLYQDASAIRRGFPARPADGPWTTSAPNGHIPPRWELASGPACNCAVRYEPGWVTRRPAMSLWLANVASDRARVRATSQVASRRSAYLRFSTGRWASAASIASSAAQSTWGATPRPSQLVPVTESVQYPHGSSPVTVAASRISVT